MINFKVRILPPIYNLNKDLVDTGWIDATLSGLFKEYTTGSSGPEYRREGKRVYIRGVVSPKQNITGNTDSNTIFVLPEGFRPSKTEYCECQGSAKATWFLDITTGGEVRMSRYGAGSFQTAEVNCWLPFSYNFPVD